MHNAGSTGRSGSTKAASARGGSGGGGGSSDGIGGTHFVVFSDQLPVLAGGGVAALVAAVVCREVVAWTGGMATRGG